MLNISHPIQFESPEFLPKHFGIIMAQKDNFKIFFGLSLNLEAPTFNITFFLSFICLSLTSYESKKRYNFKTDFHTIQFTFIKTRLFQRAMRNNTKTCNRHHCFKRLSNYVNGLTTSQRNNPHLLNWRSQMPLISNGGIVPLRGCMSTEELMMCHTSRN